MKSLVVWEALSRLVSWSDDVVSGRLFSPGDKVVVSIVANDEIVARW